MFLYFIIGILLVICALQYYLIRMRKQGFYFKLWQEAERNVSELIMACKWLKMQKYPPNYRKMEKAYRAQLKRSAEFLPRNRPDRTALAHELERVFIGRKMIYLKDVRGALARAKVKSILEQVHQHHTENTRLFPWKVEA